MLYNAVTWATRLAKLVPGSLIRVEVIGHLPKALSEQLDALRKRLAA